MSPIKNVIVIGGSGNLGTAVLSTLDQDPELVVSVLSRKSSSSTFPPHLKIHKVNDNYPENEVLDAFKDQDAVVCVLNHSAIGAQKRLIDVAIKAGVKRFIPTEFGSAPECVGDLKELKIFAGKKEILDYLKSQGGKGLTWTAFYTGPFFDWGMQIGFLGFDLQTHKATIYDSGNTKWSATNLEFIARAILRSLQKYHDTANKELRIHSHTVSQNEILAAFEKASGKKWDVQRARTAETKENGLELTRQGDFHGFGLLIVSSLNDDESGNLAAYKESESDNKMLGLSEENLDEVARRLFRK